MDRRLVPALALLLFLMVLDSSNIANAKIEGMDEELELYGSRYNIVLCVFYVPYILAGEFEVPKAAPALEHMCCDSLSC